MTTSGAPAPSLETIMLDLDCLTNAELFGPFCYKTELDRRYWRAFGGYNYYGAYTWYNHLIMDDFGNLVEV